MNDNKDNDKAPNAVTCAVSAWMTSSFGPEILELEPEVLVSRLFYGTGDYANIGWVRVGNATITVELVSTDALVANKVEALKGELQSVRAAAQLRENQINDQIQNLLALTYDKPAVSEPSIAAKKDSYDFVFPSDPNLDPTNKENYL